MEADYEPIIQFGVGVSLRPTKALRSKRGSAIICILLMVLAIAFIVSVAATYGRVTNDWQYRYERDAKVQCAWDAAVSQADAKESAGSFSSFPATFSISLNGVTGTITVADNSGTMANSLKVTSTLTASDGKTYLESAIIAKSGGTLNGNFWWTNGTVVTSDAAVWSYMMANPTPTGTFTANLLNYNGVDTTKVKTWLSTDSSAYSGTNQNFEDGLVELYGYITIPTANTVIQVNSDDGTYVSIDGDRWVINNDGDHQAQTATVKVTAAGTYPIFITYYNDQYQSGTGTVLFQLTWDSSGQQTGTYTSIPSSDLQVLNQNWSQNGNASSYFNGSELVDGGSSEAGSAFVTTKQTVSSFHCAFDFQFGGNLSSKGLTFCIQNSGSTAVGNNSTGYGYKTISTAMCLAFSLGNNIGVTTGNSNPSPATATSPVVMSSGDLMHCVLSYSGTTLSVNLTDQNTGDNYTGSFTVNITTAVGASTAYVGFTGSTSSGSSNTTAYVTNFNFGP
jgi:hypothetical protein